MYDFSLHELKIIKAEFEKFSGENPNQEELLKTEKFFYRILKNNNAIKLLVDRETFQIKDSNELAQEFYGYSARELEQKQIFELNSLTKEEVIIEYERALTENRDYFESKQKDSKDKIKKVIVRSTPIKLSGKNHFYLVIHEIDNDNKEQKTEEVTKKEAPIFTLPNSAGNEELDNDLEIIEKNARDLVVLSNKLAESEKKLKNLNASKDRFFSIISHDLKNSFFSIMSLSEKLADRNSEKTAEQKENLAEMLHANSKKLYSLLENLLTWAGVKRGETVYEPTHVKINELVAEIISIFKLKADEKKITLENAITDEDIEVFADQNMVKTILRNLVSNALNFTNSGGSVKVLSETKNDEVILIIEDNGLGISEENQQKLFQIDQKYIGTNSEGEKGTGLGLILCKEFIEKHGKEIWIESELGKGSRFCFTLPIVKQNSK